MSRFGFSNAAAKPEPVNAPEVAEPTAPKPAPPAPADTKAFDQLDAKLRIHAKLIDELDLSVLDKLDDETMRRRVRGIVSEIIKKEEMALSATEEASFADAVMDEMTGLGPIEPLLKDDSIADILINGFDQVYVERHGKLQLAPVRFADNDHLLRIVQRIVAAVGRRVDESQPLVDARLLDGSRVNAAVLPIAIDGPLVSIRKFSKSPLTMEKLVGFGAIPEPVAKFILGAVKCRASTVISGGTGSGKTTLLNALSAAINEDERLITIEDAAELQLQQPHVARMETRPPNIEGKGEIRQRELVKNALRMRPDRVILGEVRSEEAFDMLQAMNTGHDGSMGTLHANSPREALSRLESMITMGGFSLPAKTIREMIVGSVDIVVQATRLRDGSRRITHITEVIGMEGDVIVTQDLIKYEMDGEDADGNIIGEHRSTGIARPAFWDRARYFNLEKDLALALDEAGG